MTPGCSRLCGRGDRAHLRRRGIKAVIPEKSDRAANRSRKGRRGGRPVTCDAELYKRKPQRVTLHSWSFHQLGSFIAYKAKRAGVPVVHVDPAHTSRECSRCHHVARADRPSRAVFSGGSCGFAEHADHHASHDISHRGWYAWVRGAESQAPALTPIA